MVNRDCMFGALAKNCTFKNKTYADAFEWVLSTITKIRDAQQTLAPAGDRVSYHVKRRI